MGIDDRRKWSRRRQAEIKSLRSVVRHELRPGIVGDETTGEIEQQRRPRKAVDRIGGNDGSGGIVDRETVERRMDPGQIGGVSSVPADTWPITPSNSVETGLDMPA